MPTAKPERSVIPATPDVAKLVDGYKGRAAISQGEAFDPSPANIDARTEKTTLANGAKLALLAKKTRGETVNGSFSFAFGDEKSLFGRGAVPSLVASMLERGSGKLSRAEISDRLDQLKAKLSVSGSGQEVNVDFETTRANLPALLDLVASLLKQPSFPEREFVLLRKEGLTAIDAQRNEPQAIATQAVGQALNVYRKGDLRYRPTLDEAAAELKTAKLDDIKRFHRQFYGASHARFALVGDFDAKATQNQLQNCSAAGAARPLTAARPANCRRPSPVNGNCRSRTRPMPSTWPPRRWRCGTATPTIRRCWSPTRFWAAASNRGCWIACARKKASATTPATNSGREASKRWPA